MFLGIPFLNFKFPNCFTCKNKQKIGQAKFVEIPRTKNYLAFLACYENPTLPGKANTCSATDVEGDCSCSLVSPISTTCCKTFKLDDYSVAFRGGFRQVQKVRINLSNNSDF